MKFKCFLHICIICKKFSIKTFNVQLVSFKVTFMKIIGDLILIKKNSYELLSKIKSKFKVNTYIPYTIN